MSDKLTVEQVDRDAASEALDALLCAIDPVLLSPDEAEELIAQAFARHRQSALTEMREALLEAELRLWQYKDDLRYPPEDDSVERRIAAADKVIEQIRAALSGGNRT